MNKDYYLLQKSDGSFAVSGRPCTIRVYESIESAVRGRRGLGKSLKIVKFSQSDVKEVDGS